MSSAPGRPESPDGEGDRPGPDATEVFDAIGVPEPPEVMAFRMKRPVVGYQLTAPVPSADQAGADDTVQTPAPGRPPAWPPVSRGRVTSAAVHADAATWAASEVPGQAAVSDPAV